LIVLQNVGYGQNSVNGILTYTSVNGSVNINDSMTHPLTTDNYVADGSVLAFGYMSSGFSADDGGANTLVSTQIRSRIVDSCCEINPTNAVVSLTFGSLISQISTPACGSGTQIDPYRVFLGGAESRPCV
jgi:hypothetical protein